MNRSYKILLAICLFLAISAFAYLINPIFAPIEPFNGFSGEGNDTIIICTATGDMRGLEVGVASYAGKEGIPLILTSKTIPFPLNEWIPLFKDKAKIKKVVVVGPVSSWQVEALKMLNLEVESIDGSSKGEILTDIAEKTYKSPDTVIITDSNPSASLLGAYMDVPVFVVAEPGKYTSSETLDPTYESYLSNNSIKNVIIVGSVSQSIIDNLNAKNIQIDEIKGGDSFETSAEVSDRVIDILDQRGVVANTAYAGFYGELPSIIPLAVQDNSIILVDPTIHMDETVDYLQAVRISDVVITRNGPADYLQMEEPDFVSSRVMDKLHSAGINTSILANFRTINEATGLFETKMMAAEQLYHTGDLWSKYGDMALNPSSVLLPVKTGPSEYPPILDVVIDGGNWESTTGSRLTVMPIGLNHWYFQWKGIHPYIWQKNNDNDWYCFSGSKYSWHWIHGNKTDDGIVTANDTWTVEYLSDNKVYNRVYWVKKGDVWEEIHSEATFKWEQRMNSWICSRNGVTDEFGLSPTQSIAI